MRALAAIIVALLALAGALVVFAPATLLDGRLFAASDEKLRLAGATGTVWEGRGLLVERSGALRVPVAWTLAPWPLLRGIVAIDLVPGDMNAGLRGHLTIRDGRVHMQRFDAVLPVSASLTGAANNGWHAGGQVQVRSDDMVVARSGGNGSARIQWRRARLVAPTGLAIDLGTASVMLEVRGNEFAGPIEAAGGDITAKGSIAVGPGGARIDVALAPSPGSPAEVRNAIAGWGTPDAAGAVRLQANYPLR